MAWSGWRMARGAANFVVNPYHYRAEKYWSPRPITLFGFNDDGGSAMIVTIKKRANDQSLYLVTAGLVRKLAAAAAQLFPAISTG